MEYCHVSNQIAEHCNVVEVNCPECGAEMTEERDGIDTVLICDNDECEHRIYQGE